MSPIVVIVAPIFSALICSLSGRHFGRRGSIWINTVALILSCLISWFTLWSVLANSFNQIVYKFGQWLPTTIGANWNFLIDTTTIVMFVVVTTVSSLVHIYSMAYMAADPHIIRFFIYLSLFTVFMLLLVSSDNIFILFLGWEGVGLCSYLLINFWFTRLQANKAALKAMFVNRIGDVALILAMGLSGSCISALSYPVYYCIPTLIKCSSPLLTVGCWGFLIAAIGKSAQIGLHTWLPDAMEGPTPVSSLIHAATMVTAGVFLLIRISGWIAVSNCMLRSTAIFGALTAILAGSIGLSQFDIKKVIAYSTCSQLGYMVMICGASFFSLSLFHLFNHAFFKALLFPGSGSIIHAMADEQDMRRYGVINYRSPALGIFFFIASIALMGLPFLAGFYSKDPILEAFAAYGSDLALWCLWMGLTAAFLTAAYSAKLAYWTFFQPTTSSWRPIYEHWHCPGRAEYLVLGILAAASIFIGYLFKDVFLGFGTRSLCIGLTDINATRSGEFIPLWIKLLPLLGSIAALMLVYFLIIRRPDSIMNTASLNVTFYETFQFLSHKWYFNLIQNSYGSLIIAELGYSSFWIWDRWLLEQFTVFSSLR